MLAALGAIAAEAATGAYRHNCPLTFFGLLPFDHPVPARPRPNASVSFLLVCIAALPRFTDA